MIRDSDCPNRQRLEAKHLRRQAIGVVGVSAMGKTTFLIEPDNVGDNRASTYYGPQFGL